MKILVLSDYSEYFKLFHRKEKDLHSIICFPIPRNIVLSPTFLSGQVRIFAHSLCKS